MAIAKYPVVRYAPRRRPVRCGRNRWLDSDNLQGSLKGVRDQVAA
ncbi:MAG: hypothetical protein ACT6R4_10655 [Variovorax sp.]